MDSPVLLAHEQRLLERIRQTVRQAEPAARLILFGSRARGDAAPDSDWDLLIVLDGIVRPQRADAVRHRLYDLALDTDTVLSAITCSRERWESLRYRATPLHARVAADGVVL